MPDRLTLAEVADKVELAGPNVRCDCFGCTHGNLFAGALRELAAWRGAGSWTDIEPLGKATDAALAAIGEAGKGESNG